MERMHAPSLQGSTDLSSDILRLRRCPVCDYSLDGLPRRHRCPECAFEYDESMFSLRASELRSRKWRIVFWLFVVSAIALQAVMRALIARNLPVTGPVFGMLILTALAIVTLGIGWKRRAAALLLVTSDGIGLRAQGPGHGSVIAWPELKRVKIRPQGLGQFRLSADCGSWSRFAGGTVIDAVFTCSAGEAQRLVEKIDARLSAARAQHVQAWRR